MSKLKFFEFMATAQGLLYASSTMTMVIVGSLCVVAIAQQPFLSQLAGLLAFAVVAIIVLRWDLFAKAERAKHKDPLDARETL